MTEGAAYAACCLALLAFARCLERPTVASPSSLALGALALAAGLRAAARRARRGARAGACARAPSADPRSTIRAPRRPLARLWPLLVVLGGACVALAVRAALGNPLAGYGDLWRSYDVGRGRCAGAGERSRASVSTSRSSRSSSRRPRSSRSVRDARRGDRPAAAVRGLFVAVNAVLLARRRRVLEHRVRRRLPPRPLPLLRRAALARPRPRSWADRPCSRSRGPGSRSSPALLLALALLATLPTYLLNDDGGRRFDAIASGAPVRARRARSAAPSRRAGAPRRRRARRCRGRRARRALPALARRSSRSPSSSRSSGGIAWDDRIDAARNVTFAPLDAATTAWVDAPCPTARTVGHARGRRLGRDAGRAPADGVLQRLDRPAPTTSARATRRRSPPSGPDRRRRRRRRRDGPGRGRAGSSRRRALAPRRRAAWPRARVDGPPALARDATRFASSTGVRPVRERCERAWRWATDLVGTRRGGLVVVAAALVVFAVQSARLADRTEAATSRRTSTVYVDFWNADAVFPWAMVTRTPVAPLVVGGILDLGSPVVVELVRGTALRRARFSSTRERRCSSGRARPCSSPSRSSSTPATASLFHELATRDRLRCRASRSGRPSSCGPRSAHRPGAFAALAGRRPRCIALTRPANQVFLVVALLPLLLAGLAGAPASAGRAAFGGVAVVLLGCMVDVNLVRFDDFTVARGGQREPAALPRVRRRPYCPSDNGAASRELARRGRARAARRGAVPLVRHRPRDVLREGSPRHARGPDQPLRPASGAGTRTTSCSGRSAGRASARIPGRSRASVLGDFWEELSQPLFAGREAPTARSGAGRPRRATGRRRSAAALPTPTEGEAVPSEHQSAQLSTPDGSIREVWTSPTEHHVVFDDPAKPSPAGGERPAAWPSSTPPSRTAGRAPGSGSRWTGRRSSIRRSGCGSSSARSRSRRGGPRRWWATLTPVAASLAMLLATVMAVWAEPAYAVPVAPAFILFAAVGPARGANGTPTARRARAGSRAASRSAPSR